MNPAYWMVLVNVIASSLLILGILTYRFIYPKKHINLFVLLIFISLLPVISIFRYGDYDSGDFNIHIYRTIDFVSSLQQGIFLPSWAGNLNATYGYPLFLFLNPLPYYTMALFHFLGASFIGSIKLLLALSYIFSGILFYVWAKKEVGNSLAAFSSAIVYLFAPYHLIDLHFRNDVGEVMFFTLLPLIFYCLKTFSQKLTFLWFLLASVVFAFLMFSHQAMAVFSMLIIAPYILYNTFISDKKIKVFLFSFLSLAGGLVISVYSWLPHLIYPKYTLAYLLTQQDVQFESFITLLYSPYRYGFLFQGSNGEITYIIGYTLILILLMSIVLLIKNNLSKKMHLSFLLWTLLSIFLIFLMTNYSEFLWKLFPILGTVQFTSRLLLILVFTVSAVTTHLTIRLRNQPLSIYLLIILTIGTSILNWGHRGLLPQITDKSLIAGMPLSTIIVEGYCCMAQPIWTLPQHWVGVIPKQHIQITRGSGVIKQLTRTETMHTYLSYAKQPFKVQENTWYFPGWQLFIDGTVYPLGVTKGKNSGVMQFVVPSGLHKIAIVYTDLWQMTLAKIISVVSLFLSLLLIIKLSFGKRLTYSFDYKKQTSKKRKR